MEGFGTWAALSTISDSYVTPQLAGANVISVGAGSTATSFKVQGSNYKPFTVEMIYHVTLLNNSNFNNSVSVYDCVPREHVSEALYGGTKTAFSTFVGSFNDSINDDAGIQNGTAAIPALPTGFSNRRELPTYTPLQTKRFTDTFRILNIRTVNLGPKERTSFTIKLRKKLFDSRIIGDLVNGDVHWIRNWSRSLVIKILGENLTNNAGQMLHKMTSLYVEKKLYCKVNCPFQAAPARIALQPALNANTIEGVPSVEDNSTGTAANYKAPVDYVVQVAAAGEDEVAGQAN